ncbi:MAG: chitobiase/beta-hexosaminidase C-terminal domain-containing protein, partial [Thermoleophilia bacterium]
MATIAGGSLGGPRGMKVMWRRTAPRAGDEVDLVNHTPAGAHGGERRRSRVSRAPARTLAVSALTLFLALAIGPGVARAATYNTWTARPSGVTTTLYGVCFTDANNGWVVSTAGVIRHTTNGGTAWAAQALTPTTNQTLRSVSFVSSQVGWAVGGGGVIYHTTNGGTAWTTQTSGITGTIYGVDFTDANNGWYVAAGGLIYHTANGGTTWSKQTTPNTQQQRGIVFAGGSLWTCGAAGNVWTYLVDTTPPVTTASGLQADNHSGWQATSPTVTLSATDGQSGVAATYYTIDGGARQTYSAPFTIAAQGSHAVVYWSVDAGGNTETSHTGYVNIDTTAPVTTATGLQTDNHSGWTKTTPQSVSLTATDAQSGVATTNYTLDGVAHLYTGAPFLVAGNGSHTITYWSTDGVGNVEATHTGYVNIDTSAPVTTATGLQPGNQSGWQNVSQVVSLGANDALSGVAATYYTLDGATQTYTNPFTVSAQGSHLITYWSVDAVGNIETANTGYVNIDTTAPTVTDDADGLWHDSPVPVHLSPIDTGGSGLAGTQYRLQGGSSWSAAVGNVFVVPAPPGGAADGVHVYQYRALDNAGNSSSIGSCTVWIDTTPPTTTATGLQPDNLSGWRTTSQTVSLSADDGSGSGVTSISYSVDGAAPQTYSGPFTVSGTGQHPVTYAATDAAGNVETTHTGWVNISNPYAQATNLVADNDSGWQKAATMVTITGSGDHVPIAVWYGVDGGTPTQASGNPASFTESVEGSHTVVFYATNNLNVESVPETGYVNLDLTPPTTTASGLQANDHSGWQTTSQSVTLGATDALSGVAVTYYTVDGGAAQLYAGGPFLVGGEGSHPVTYWSVDAAGNIEGTHTGYVNIDTTPPVTTATGLQLDNHSGWTKTTPQTVSLSASDGGSGMTGGSAATYYTIDGVQHTYSGSFTVSAEGSHTVTYWSVDAVGNIEGTHTGYVNIDLTPPVTTATGLQADNHSGWRNTSQTVTLTGDDGSGSGVASISYTVDGGAAQTYSAPFTVSGFLQHQVTYWATDAAGNVEATHTGWVNISNPYTTVTNLAANNHSGWHKSATTVTITGSGDSSPFTIHYKVDAGSWQSVPSAASVVVSGQGSHTVAFYAVNSVSASSVHQTGYVNIDLTRPTTTATGLQANNHSGWRTTSRTVTFAATDALSGVAHTYYKLGSGSQKTYTGTPVQISGQGSHAVTYWSVDAAGNIETSHTGYVNIDTTPPTVTSSADGAWHNSPVTVKLNATDALSGVASTQYRAQGSSTWTVAAGNAFVVPAPANGSNDGAHVYQYRALDQAGNASATGTCTVRVDTQGPTVTNDADPYWHNSAVTVHLAAADANAGVASVSYRLTGTTSWTTTSGATAQITVPVPADGQPHRYSYDYQATDKAGNLSAVKTLVVLIDPSMPNTTVAGLPAKPWTNMPVSLTFTATSGAGAPIVRTEYSMNGGTSWTTFTAGTPLVISQPGVTTVL